MTTPGPAAQPWALPSFDGPPTAASIEGLEQQAWKEGEARGYVDGLKRGTAEVRERVHALDTLIAALAAPLDEQDTLIATELQRTAWTLAELLARSQLRHDPRAVAQLVHEAITALAAPNETLTIEVAPTQRAAIQGALAQEPSAQQWQLQARTDIKPGDCRVVGAHATADARLTSRLRELAEQLLDTPQPSNSEPEPHAVQELPDVDVGAF